MAAADIFKGILAVGAGAARGYVQKKREDKSAEMKQMLKDAELAVRMENIRRMAAEDQSEAARRLAQTQNDATKSELAAMKQMFFQNNQWPQQAALLGARIGDIGEDNRRAWELARSLMLDRTADNARGDARLDAQYPKDPATGQRVPATRSTGRGRVSQALQAFKSLTTQSRQGVSGAVLEAIQAAEEDDEFLDYLLPKLDESGIRLKKRLSKEDIEKLDAVARTALEVRRRANSAQAPPASAPTIGPDRLTE